MELIRHNYIYFSKKLIELINLKGHCNYRMAEDYEKEAKENGSIFQLGAFLKYTKIDEVGLISS